MVMREKNENCEEQSNFKSLKNDATTLYNNHDLFRIWLVSFTSANTTYFQLILNKDKWIQNNNVKYYFNSTQLKVFNGMLC